MKTTKILSLAVGTMFLSLMIACDKKESAEPTVNEPVKAPEATAPPTPAASEPAAASIKETAAEAQQQVETAAKELSSQAQEKIQTIIDQAKGLTEESKFEDAITKLQELANYELTPEQQKLVDQIKETIKTAMAKKAADDASSEATKAIGGLLNDK